MTRSLLIIVVVIVAIFRRTLSSSIQQPPNPCNSSESKKKLVLNCTVPTGESLNFTDIRMWAAEGDHTELIVRITCAKNGIVFIRKPFRAKHITLLSITSCILRHVYDYVLDEIISNNSESLTVLEFLHVIYVITAREMWNMYVVNAGAIIQKYPCDIPKSLKRYVERNITIKVALEEGWTYDYIRKIETERERYLLLLPVCLYEDLIYYEKSYPSILPNNEVRDIFDRGRFPRLVTLNFTGLGLTNVDYKLFRQKWWIDFPELKELDLSFNNITSIPFMFFNKRSKEKLHINLRANNITVISNEQLNHLSDAYGLRIDLRGNPFDCKCSQKDLIAFIQTRKESHMHFYSYLDKATCTSPPKHKGKLLVNFDEWDVCPLAPEVGSDSSKGDRDVQFIIYIVLPALCFSVLIVCLFVHYRKELQVLAFTRLNIVFSQSASIGESNHDKDFDAFVSYNTLDEKWVNSTCKRLEDSTHKFKLCLHHKHFLPGACIADNIIESVERSQHTIMVMSRNFLKSEWCILEFRKAFHQSLIERKRHLVVILLEDLDESQMPADMKYFLQTYTYLKVSETLFWDKLIYTLSADRGRSSSTSSSLQNAIIDDRSTERTSRRSKNKTNDVVVKIPSSTLPLLDSNASAVM